MKEYTPSEQAEAQDKFEQHQKGREEAKFYREFLDKLKDQVTGVLLKSGADQGQRDRLEDFESAGILNLKQSIDDAISAANKGVDKPVEHVNVRQELLAEMTQREFVEYIERLKSSLIK